MWRLLIIGFGIATALALGFVKLYALPVSPGATKASAEPTDVPAGILLSRVRIDGSGGRGDEFGFGGNRGRVSEAFTDGAGRPLYFSSHDREPGKSNCIAACLEKWQPALPTPGAQAAGDWSVLTREDGRRQWAFRGKPLYTFVNEPEFKDDPHFSVGRTPPGRLQPVAGHGVDNAWFAAEAQPVQWMDRPAGISTAEVTQAPGQVLVELASSKALYTFSGTAAEQRKLPESFRPYRAAMLDLSTGDFTIKTRFDGTRQWAYNGAPLFTFDGDLEVGDVNGKDVVPGIAPAVVLHYPMPDEAALQKDQKNGGRLIEAKTGQTLYVRDRLYYSLTSNYIRGAQRLDPVVGKAIGVSGCEAECEQTWKPLLAPQDAQPRGYWTLFDRPDGRKQWAYRNYALYTHPSDPPGTLYGAETWDVSFNEGYGKVPPAEHGLGLFFRAAWP